MGLSLLTVKTAAKVGRKPAGLAPLLELRRHTAEVGIFLQCCIPEGKLPIKQALGVSRLAITPVIKDWMWTGKHDQKLR